MINKFLREMTRTIISPVPRFNKMSVGALESVQEEDLVSLEEARKALGLLRERHNTQSRVLLDWRSRLREQKLEIKKIRNEKEEMLSKLQSQLLMVEGRLRKGQKEVETSLAEKDRTLRRQHQLILALATALTRRGGQQDLQELIPNLKLDITTETKEKRDNVSQTEKERTPSLVMTSLKSDLESLNDSDSAIMLEDTMDSLVYIPLGKGEVKVVRSVSDAVECVTRGNTGYMYQRLSSVSTIGKNSIGEPSSLSASSCSSEEGEESPVCTLSKTNARRNLLRTVYSLDETMISNARKEIDQLTHKLSSISLVPHSPQPRPSILKHSPNYDSDATISEGDGESDCETVTSLEDSTNERRLLIGSYEKLNKLSVSIGRKKPEEEIQVTYNRVMSNHRSVTKPKDVKYKRINKAKSRSLEELRGKLRLWDGRNSQPTEGYQTQSFA